MIKISLNNIRKGFKIGFKKKQSTLSRVGTLVMAREVKKEIIVLHNISLDVSAGEILGIIGKNGSGKSTLLRIIADIYKPDSGSVVSHGKVISLINLGTGLKERLTMKENIFLVGSLFGMNQKEISERLDSIVDFSELKEFLHTKIYQFSAGMLQRLAFSIAIHSEPDILLLDEVFEVGDEIFRRNSAKKIQELVKSGLAVIFVTHDLDMIRKQCHRVIWLENGKIHMSGKPEEITTKYEQGSH